MLRSDAAPERPPSAVYKPHPSRSAAAASKLPTLVHLQQKLQGFVVKLNLHKTILTESPSIPHLLISGQAAALIDPHR